MRVEVLKHERYLVLNKEQFDLYSYDEIKDKEEEESCSAILEEVFEKRRLMKQELYSFEDVVEIIKEFKDDDFLTFEQKAFLKNFIENHCGDNEDAKKECMHLCHKELGMKDSEDEVN